MTDLFWPGDERAGDLFSESALLHAMVRVESAWLDALVGAGLAPGSASAELDGLVSDDDVPRIAQGAEAGGNPVLPLLTLLRERLGDSEAATWLHRGLTSQDVVDTALVLCTADVVDRLDDELTVQVRALARLVETHRTSLMAGRTLAQHAVPVTFGLKAAQWLQGILDAQDALAAVPLPVQVGGAAGTLAAVTELATGQADPALAAVDLVDGLAATLSLASRPPWHTSRSPVTGIGDALMTATDAFGRIANDVLVLSRPEIGELAEAVGRGGSSTMPHKANPVLSVLIRRAALAAPGLGTQLHLAAASAVDERPDGGWHVEWSALATLARRTVVAASQTSELATGLRVNTVRMRATAETARDDLLAEQRSLASLTDSGSKDLTGYLGATNLVIDAVLERARPYLPEETR
jgi:3-carboxy-cis,cis-muconate cycloisomerase